MAISKEQVIGQLRHVRDPKRQADLVSLDAVKGVTISDGIVRFTLHLASGERTAVQALVAEAEAAVRKLGDEVKGVNIDIAAAVVPPGAPGSPGSQDQAADDNPLPDVRHIIAVGAGKGGVGKSTIAVNLAVALARQGAAVGLMDGDIYGPSLPTMLATDKLKVQGHDQTIEPFEVHGIKAMTIGALVEPDRPLIWRGPMAHGAFKQLALQTNWGTLDYLIIDLPPGTGDVPLTMSQLLPLTGAVVVCTPQKVAQDDATRALKMFEQLNIDIIGVVENMSYFIGDDGKEYDIFGRGGAEKMAKRMGAYYLGGIPINMALRKNCDAGDPTANFTANDTLAGDLTTLASNVANQVTLIAAAVEQPTISIS